MAEAAPAVEEKHGWEKHVEAVKQERLEQLKLHQQADGHSGVGEDEVSQSAPQMRRPPPPSFATVQCVPRGSNLSIDSEDCA